MMIQKMYSRLTMSANFSSSSDQSVYVIIFDGLIHSNVQSSGLFIFQVLQNKNDSFTLNL